MAIVTFILSDFVPNSDNTKPAIATKLVENINKSATAVYTIGGVVRNNTKNVSTPFNVIVSYAGKRVYADTYNSNSFGVNIRHNHDLTLEITVEYTGQYSVNELGNITSTDFTGQLELSINEW